MIVSHQLLSLLAMVGTGILTAAAIDIIRTAGGGTRAGTAIELMAWPLLGLFAFSVLFAVRSGEWRLYDLLAQLVGVLLYESALHRPFRFAGRLIAALVIRPILFLLGLLCKIAAFIVGIPVRLILFLARLLLIPFRKPMRAIRRKAGNLSRKVRRKLPASPLKKRSA
ncbi:Spore cortex protein YabQ (Spore_YabQ) [Bhargavaea beijingensis]|uniref:Spore cortex protein YabQ (Spore_YabQ) n=1 Tax=Bhargavaea beijingensis TaxID=426756 RepID=A0A1G7FNQ2_9BACL|nr:spore cortex biosynthesis protein YabQ [Bhargavaea beijingensis]SDE77484.1 Spore cortex protein YabQ (Spore_YabQ) [Bhargavaea beijingensis]